NGLGAHRRILPSARAMYSRHRALSQRSSGARLRRPLPRTISNHAPTVRRNSEAKLDSGPNSFHRAAKSREEQWLSRRRQADGGRTRVLDSAHGSKRAISPRKDPSQRMLTMRIHRTADAPIAPPIERIAIS